jgi:hypothetical protein
MIAQIPETHADLIDNVCCVALTTIMPNGPRTIDGGRCAPGTGEGLGREILRCTQDRLSAIGAGWEDGGRVEEWKIGRVEWTADD